MKKTILFIFLLATGSLLAQDDSHSRVKAELVEWDAVRGEWLAESFNAMANNQPIPDRTFPEDLTPAEMYSLVPAERQGRIREIVNQPDRTNNPRENSNPPTNQSGRVPVGEPVGNNRPNNTGGRYNYYVTRPGCPLTMGRSYGDPHIRTFDGKTYSFQTVGEYVLSSSPDRRFEVQARQKPQTNQVSLNTAVAMNVYGDRVGIYASDLPDGQTGTPVRVNGRPVYLNNETFYLPHGGTVQHTGREYIVTWPTGEKVQARMSSTSGMRFMNVSVYVYECNGNYFGLMGNANGRSDDDFAGGNRNDLASSTIFEPFGSRDFGRTTTAMEREHLAFIARDFGSQFLVNDQTSLFDYGFGQSSWTFYDASFPRTHLTLGDLSQADRDRARRECERQGILADEMAGCVMDLAHANVQPTPRPNNPNRTNGRELNPVSERKPNVNRPDAFERERVPKDRGSIRTPSGGTGRENGSGAQVISGREEPVNDREVKPARENKPITVGGIEEPSNEREVRPSRESGSETISKPSTTRPQTNSESGKEVRKPAENTGKEVKKPSGTTSNPVSRPADKPVSQPSTDPGRSNPGTSKPASGSTSRTQTSDKGTSTTSGSVSRSQKSAGESSKSSSGSSSKSSGSIGSSGTSQSTGGRSGSSSSPSRGR